MMVIRLVVLSVLLYIAWVLLRAMFERKPGVRGKASKDQKVQDTLVEDPVCHRLVPKHQAIRLRSDGQTYYFCSEECCDKFSATPRGEE